MSCVLSLTFKNCQFSDRQALREQFKNPPQSCRPLVYWFWNGDISEAEIKRQLQIMDSSGTVGAACILAWEGLTVEYLSDTWFERIEYACQIAAELELDVWLYDEWRWPSPHAGGKILQNNPELRGKCLDRTVVKAEAGQTVQIPVAENTVAAIAVNRDPETSDEQQSIELNIENAAEALNWTAPAGRWDIQIFEIESCDFKTTFTDLSYTDLLDPETGRQFIEMTHEAYYERMPQYFGTVIKSIITDEPGLYCDLKPWLINPGTIPWSPRLPEEFQKRKGYDLAEHLPHLWQNVNGKSAGVRIDFYEVLAAMLQDYYFKPLADWCEAHNIKLNIQPSHEETTKFAVKLMGDYFAAMEYSHIQAVDEVYSWDKSAITPKIGNSAARAFGRRELYAEVFGAYGWDLSPQKMKAVTDWLFVRGVNRLMLSSFYFTMDSESWHFEIPPSLFDHNPFWKYLPFYTDYTARLTALLTEGQHIADIALLYPTQSAQALSSPEDESAVDSLDKALNAISNLLLAGQVDFNYLDEKTFLRKTTIVESETDALLHFEQGSLQNDYRVLILPPLQQCSATLMEKITRFYETGGRVIFCGTVPEKNFKGDDFNEKILSLLQQADKAHKRTATDSGRMILFEMDEINRIPSFVKNIHPPDVLLSDSYPDINYMHKIRDGLDIYFLSNNGGQDVETEISFKLKGTPQLWDAETGVIEKVTEYRYEQDRTMLPVHFAPYGSKLIVFDRRQKRIGAGKQQVIYRNEYKAPVIARIPLKPYWQFRSADESIQKEIRISGSWTERQQFNYDDELIQAPAHPHFSGTGIYSQTFSLADSLFSQKRRFFLRTDRVREVMEVKVNGQKAGVRCWPPFELEITDNLKAGANQIEIAITNTLANRYVLIQKPYTTGEDWGRVVPSGLIDPLEIVVCPDHAK